MAIFAFNVPFPADRPGRGAHRLSRRTIRPGEVQQRGGHGDGEKSFGPALIDDDTPTPEHARFSLVDAAAPGVDRRSAVVLCPWRLLTALFGWDGTLTQMGWFFTKAALLTFGGAYAVLPYVYQGAVGHYGWLTPTQMIDGLALGETTPGPLIMVVAFVGFVGAYVQPSVRPRSCVCSPARWRPRW